MSITADDDGTRGAKTESAYAVSYRSGLLEVLDHAVIGAITLVRGPKAALETAIAATARSAHDRGTWIVPGIPEAAGDDKAAFEALLDYAPRLKRALDDLAAELTEATP